MDADKDPQAQVATDADSRLKEVLRSQRQFRSEAFWSDFGAVGILLLLIPMWIYLGVKTSSLWTWYLTVPVFVWLIVFILFYRARHRQKPGEQGESFLGRAKAYLTEVEDHIWLQRNMFWWELLPLFISLTAFFVHLAWLKQPEYWSDVLGSLGFMVGGMSVLAIVFVSVYIVSRNTVRSKLEPQRQELLTLLAEFEADKTG